MNSKLSVHLPFCLKMLSKVRNTELENKWQKLHDLLTCNELSAEHAERVDKTLLEIRAKLENSRNVQQNIEQHANLHENFIQPPVEPQVDEMAIITSNESPKEKSTNDSTTDGQNIVKFKTKIISKKKKGEKSSKLIKATEHREKINADSRPRIPLLKIKLSEVFKKGLKKRLHKEQKKKKKELKKLKKRAERESKIADRQPVQMNQEPVLAVEASAEPKQPEIPVQKEFLNCFVPLTRCDENSSTSSVQLTEATGSAKQKPYHETPDANVEMSLLEEIKIEPPDDVEMVDESKTLSQSRLNRTAKKSINGEVSHMAFRVINDEVLFVCKLCGFLIDSVCKFQDHIQEHKKFRWFGLCHSCDHPEASHAKSLSGEFSHMLEHLVKAGITMRSLEMPEPAPEPSKKRPMVSIPRELMNSSPPQANSPSKSLKILLDAVSTMKRLRPWLPQKAAKHQKFLSVCEEMLSLKCLSALFKCMGVGCSFYTSKKANFEQHLNNHHTYQIDDKNFSFCSYCDFESPNVNELIQHVVNEHGSDRYQCRFCFYRSYDFHVCEHQSLYHKLKETMIIKCVPRVIKNEKLEMEDVWSNFAANVPAVTCMICRAKFYNLTLFKDHLRTHKALPVSRCIKCKGNIDKIHSIMHHLKSCHGFGRVQCVFCRFGCDQGKNFTWHLVNCHPNKPAYGFNRIIVPNVPAVAAICSPIEVSKNISMVKQTFNKPFDLLVTLAIPDIDLTNDRNVNRLSENFEIVQ